MLLLHEIKKNEYKKQFSIAIVVIAVTVVALVNGNGVLNYSYDFGYLRGLAGFFTGVLCLNAFITFKSRIDALPATFFHVAETVLLLSIAFFIYEGEIFKQIGFVYLILFFLSVLLFAFEKGFVSGLLK